MAEVLKDAWIWILLAFLVGALVGYFVRGKSAGSAADAARISQLETDLAQCREGKSSAAPAAAVATSAASSAPVATADGGDVKAEPAAKVAAASAAPAKAAAKAPASKAAAASSASTASKAPAKAAASKAPATKVTASKAPAAKVAAKAAAKPSAAKAAPKAAASKPATKPAAAKPAVAADLAAAATTLGFKIKADDLTVIEGIGPKIAGLLKEDGIATWAQLGEAKVADLRAILEKAGPRYNVHEPATWPKQAKLLAGGKWAQFKKLTDELKGGRAV